MDRRREVEGPGEAWYALWGCMVLVAGLLLLLSYLEP